MSKCVNCGNDVTGKFCGHCGESAPQLDTENKFERQEVPKENEFVRRALINSLFSAFEPSHGKMKMYEDLSIDELRIIVEARSLEKLHKLGTISGIMIFSLVVSLFAAFFIATRFLNA